MVAGDGCRISPLIGYRFLQFSDHLAIDSNEQAIGVVGVVPGTQILTSDRFTALNVFHGVEIGLHSEFFGEHWSVELLTKLAVGNLNRSIGIAGTTHVTVPGTTTPVTSNGGMLALSSNSGVQHPEDWVVIPEVGLTFAWKINSNIRIRLGYSLLYWTDVARSVDQVSLNLNPNLFPPVKSTGTTPASPAIELHKSDMLIQNVSAGFEIRF
jgi:hypothetical protein